MRNALSKDMFLLIRARTWNCALPVQHVVETTPVLSIEAIKGMPWFVRGLAIIRGVPTPVVDMGALLGGADTGRAGARIVVLRVDGRMVAVLVDEVIGVREMDDVSFNQLPPLLRDAGGELVKAMGTLDSKLLMVLHASRLLPEEVSCPSLVEEIA